MVDVEIDNANQYTTVVTRFNGPDDAPVQCAYIAQWRGSRAILEATGRRHRASIHSVSSRRQRCEKVKLAHDSVLELDPFLLTQTFLTQDVF